MPTPHKHAALIKQWADDPSAIFEYRTVSNHPWVLCGGVPGWVARFEYRIKPREFPKSSLDGQTAYNIYSQSIVPGCGALSLVVGSPTGIAMKKVADEAVKQYILDEEQKTALLDTEAVGDALNDLLPREIQS